ncbi:hypothetical protein K4749_39940 [Streptomyces sp. TRM72054]|uniref:DUF5993 family protein n=1 Tax=Streptomyces sp. TRM72054 TaxID=2870562 RepID=UPI001C8CB447|nr:DUF5993 family protein [Streptomyces sp. TRM72054]MBX9399539.1 hypothetical protein [Streptomyces sp. TRM72054]
MDTIIFLMILGAFVVMVRSEKKRYAIGAWAVCLVAALLLFNHHVTSPLELSF